MKMLFENGDMDFIKLILIPIGVFLIATLMKEMKNIWTALNPNSQPEKDKNQNLSLAQARATNRVGEFAVFREPNADAKVKIKCPTCYSFHYIPGKGSYICPNDTRGRYFDTKPAEEDSDFMTGYFVGTMLGGPEAGLMGGVIGGVKGGLLAGSFFPKTENSSETNDSSYSFLNTPSTSDTDNTRQSYKAIESSSGDAGNNSSSVWNFTSSDSDSNTSKFDMGGTDFGVSAPSSSSTTSWDN